MRSQVEQWLELEEKLRHALPYSLLSAKAGMLRKLAEALDQKEYLVGDQLSLADIAIYSTLLSALTKYPVSIPVPGKHMTNMSSVPVGADDCVVREGKECPVDFAGSAAVEDTGVLASLRQQRCLFKGQGPGMGQSKG